MVLRIGGTREALFFADPSLQFNPSAQSIPTICDDATLPATEALRGIVPAVDPAVDGADTENANSAQSLKTPFNAEGLSVADIMKANGFSNFQTQAAA